MKLSNYIFLLISFLSVSLIGCREEQGILEDPYAGGKEPLGIQLLSKLPVPSAAYPGDEVVFQAKGLLKWSKPESGQYDFEFYIADEKAQIKSVTDSSITVIVPISVSTGITNVLLKGQVFYGPKLNILGNVKIDKEYGVKTGTDGSILNYLENNSQKGTYYFMGGFKTIQGLRRTQIAYVDARGNVADVNSTRYNVKEPLRYIPFMAGVYGAKIETISSMSYFSDGKILLSGNFSGYETYVGKAYQYPVLNNITILNNNVSLDTVGVSLPVYRGSGTAVRYVSRFNGGTLEPIIRSFVTSENKIIAVGDLKNYARINYPASNILENVYDYREVASVIRMDRTGALDEGYRVGAFSGASGITDAYLDKEDGLVAVGNFSSFDGTAVGHIVRLDASGKIDAQFLANIGNGANGNISMIRYNKQLEKAIIVGDFTQFNGQPRNGVAVLDRNGNLDASFIPREILGGRVNFATILNTGKIVISGTFLRYDQIARPGFLILDASGQATQRFNVPGEFTGQIYQVIETQTTTGANGLLIMGDFSRFNGEKINNIVMLEIDF